MSAEARAANKHPDLRIQRRLANYELAPEMAGVLVDGLDLGDVFFKFRVDVGLVTRHETAPSMQQVSFDSLRRFVFELKSDIGEKLPTRTLTLPILGLEPEPMRGKDAFKIIGRIDDSAGVLHEERRLVLEAIKEKCRIAPQPDEDYQPSLTTALHVPEESVDKVIETLHPFVPTEAVLEPIFVHSDALRRGRTSMSASHGT